MRIPVFILPLLLAGKLAAQDMPSVKDQAKQYVDTLAGPAMYGRGYVQGGDSLAAEWIAKQFDRIGIRRALPRVRRGGRAAGTGLRLAAR